MPDDDLTGRVPPDWIETEEALESPLARAPRGEELADLRARVAALESEQARLLARHAAEIEAENARLSADLSGVRSHASDLGGEVTGAPYLARALVAVENHLADMDVAAAQADHAAAARAKLAAATRTCAAFRRICDDDVFLEILMSMQSHAEHSDDVQQQLTGPEGEQFRAVEVQLLELVGMSRVLAERHVDAALEAYRQDPASLSRLTNPMQFLTDLRKLRDASCLTADLVGQGTAREDSRRRWRRFLTFGLGGTVIVFVNGVGTALLGPGGIAASSAIGSAAVGVAVQQVS